MMMKGIWFDDIHSYGDMNLVLSEVNIPPAIPKTAFVDIPGGDGSVDLTESLGEVKYNSREGSFIFTAFPSDDFEAKKTEVSNVLNGRRCKIRLDKDPNYYYLGRCVVDEYESDRNVHQIVVVFTVDPYKYKINETSVTFTLSTTEKTVSVENARRPVCPTITCTNANTVIVFDGNRFTFNVGTHKNLNIRFKQGTNRLTVSGTGRVTFAYQEGDL